MTYLIQEISIYLLAAFLIGAVYGWIVRGMRGRHELESSLKQHEQQLTQLQKENQALADRIEQLELIPETGAGEDWQGEYSLSVITDIEESTLAKLEASGITTTRDLWKHCDSDDAIYNLASGIGVEDFAIQRWVSISQLLRVANIEANDAALLEATEIYTLQDLAAQKPVRLGEKLSKSNARESILEAIPDEAKLQSWIEHAQHILDLEADS